MCTKTQTGRQKQGFGVGLFLTLTHLPLVHDPDEGGAVLAEGGDTELYLQELVT